MIGTRANATTDQPAHYADRPVEVIDTIREALGEEGFRVFCRGNVIKYTLRAGRKGDEAEDMRKAANYARWAHGEEWRAGHGESPTQCTDALAKWTAEHGPSVQVACAHCDGVCGTVWKGLCCLCRVGSDAPEACPACQLRYETAGPGIATTTAQWDAQPHLDSLHSGPPIVAHRVHTGERRHGAG